MRRLLGAAAWLLAPFLWLADRLRGKSSQGRGNVLNFPAELVRLPAPQPEPIPPPLPPAPEELPPPPAPELVVPPPVTMAVPITSAKKPQKPKRPTRPARPRRPRR